MSDSCPCDQWLRAPRFEQDREELVSIQWKMMRTVARPEPCHMSNGCKSYV